MTIEELKRELARRAAECEAIPGRVPALLAIMLNGLAAGIDHLESDPLACRKCGGWLVMDDESDEEGMWFCEECGAIHDVKIIRTCELAPEEEEEDE